MGTGGANPHRDANPGPTGAPKRTARRVSASDVRQAIPGQTLVCGWCGLPVVVPARGRMPKWCSSSCHCRAWEMARAAQSGRPAVQVVDRVVEVDRPIPVVEQVLVSQHGRGWPQALAELDAGRLYDRDLPALADALGQVLTALDRRPGWRRQQGR